jgi:hypothetical protein
MPLLKNNITMILKRYFKNHSSKQKFELSVSNVTHKYPLKLYNECKTITHNFSILICFNNGCFAKPT